MTSARGDYTPVYAGPTYNQATRIGSAASGLQTAADGVAIGTVNVYSGSTSTYRQEAVKFGPGGWSVLANSVGAVAADSNDGAAVGASPINGPRAAIWAADGTFTRLPFPTGFTSGGRGNGLAAARSAAGVTVGRLYSYVTGDNGFRAIRWSADGLTATPLGGLSANPQGFFDAEATDVNDRGTAIGRADFWKSAVSYIGDVAVRWDANSTAATRLRGINGSDNYTKATVVINDDTVFGAAELYVDGVSKGQRPVRWDTGVDVATPLDVLGTAANGTASGVVLAATDDGTSVGSVSKIVDGVWVGDRAVRWAAGGTAVTELGLIDPAYSGRAFSTASAINAAGVAVGNEFYAGGASRAVLWGADAVALDLNTLIDPTSGWTLTQAMTISPGGWVAGVGQFDPDSTGPAAAYSRAFLIQVPEPTLVVVFVSGTLMGRRRRA